MTTRVQGGRTATPNAPPANNSLQPGELYVEMATPLRLWTGVPVGVAATGTKLVLDAGAQAAANAGAVQKVGDTMTGPLVLSGTPTLPTQAANKAYVDTLLVSPVFTGNPTAPTPPPGDADQSVATTAFVAASYAPIASPTFTGNPQAPTPTPGDNDQSVATTAFVASAISAQPGTVIAPTIPAFKAGQLWWDATGGSLYVGYDDGNTQAYVPATNITLPANVATKADVAAAQTNVGRNLIHNSAFTVAQRGTGPWTVNGYTADRWKTAIVGDANTVSISPMPDAGRTAIGDEAARFYLANTFTGTAAAGALSVLQHPIEDVRRLAGKTVILSFYANSSAGQKLGASFDQYFGAGGSPSVSSTGVGQSVTLGTNWQRFSLTFAIPAISGIKTLGTDGTDCNTLNFWFSSGATNNTRAGNIGVQSGTITLWGVQLEIAQPGQTQPTPLEKRDPVLELQQCQRFFCQVSVQNNGYMIAGGGYGCSTAYPVTMRATPTTITLSNQNYVNASGMSFTALSPNAVFTFATATAAGIASFAGTVSASADL